MKRPDRPPCPNCNGTGVIRCGAQQPAAARLECAVWGPLRDRLAHMDCPGVVHFAYEGTVGSLARSAPLPLVCECECRTCKRSWWAQGRPVIRAGEIICDRGPDATGDGQ